MTTAAVTAAALIDQRSREEKNRAMVRWWLYCVLVVLYALFLVGGATRLTDSGLSITEWQPIHGIIPPLSAADWQEEFARYKLIPQYQQLNAGMTLDQFKTIFWWEWTHRFIARSVGFVVALPLIFFWLSGRLERGLKPRLVGLLLLGGLQGAIGWWMVASGLADRVSVSQYRLAVHLVTACLIFLSTMAIARGLAPHSAPPAERRIQLFAGWMVFFVLAQIYLGALVAGLHAGYSYNTWPLMDGRLVPGDLLAIEPAWRNFFENPKTVQFIHRWGAYFVFATALIQMVYVRIRAPGTTHARRAVLFFGLVTLQAAIGITTLLMVAPLGWSLLHLAVGLIVLAFAAAHWRGTKGAYPFETEVAAAR